MNATHLTTRAVALAGISLLTAVACGTAAPTGISDAKALISSCTGPVNTYIAIDGTASGDISALDGPRRRAITNELSQVAACGGRAKAVVFSSSSAATMTLFEGGIALSGATDQSRARRLSGAVDEVVNRISSAFDAAVPSLDHSGSDPVAQMRLFHEWTGQVGVGKPRMLELTDGFQNVGIGTEQIVADPAAAAARFAVPDLTGTEVTVAGVGEMSGSAPSTEVVDALKSFYAALCQHAGAARCAVITEAAGAVS